MVILMPDLPNNELPPDFHMNPEIKNTHGIINI